MEANVAGAEEGGGERRCSRGAMGTPITWALEDTVVILNHLTESGENSWKVNNRGAEVIYAPLSR